MPFSCHSFLSALSMWLTGNTQSALDCSQATHSLLWTIPRNMAHRQHTVCSGLFPQSPKHGSQATHTVCSGLFTGNTRSALDCSQATHTVCSGLFPKIGCLLFRTIRVSVPVASIYLEHPFLTTEVTQMCLLLLSALLSVMKNLQHP